MCGSRRRDSIPPEAARPQWGGASSAAATVASSDAALYHRSAYVNGELLTNAVYNEPRRKCTIGVWLNSTKYH